MKQIELTEEHKSKLLEMCKVLFPEYYEIYFGEWDYNGEFDGYLYFSTETLPNPNVYQIHWFEFCMKILARKIYNNNIGKTKTTYSSFVMECVIINLNHPIDYLYYEFKKLKL